MKIVLIAIQGGGKSTQGNLLSEKLKVPYLSTGHIFRELAKEHTPHGRYIKETMSAGYLIPDDKTIEIVDEYLSRPEYQSGYILDGFPRTLNQAESFKEPIDYVVYLRVSDEEALHRLMIKNGQEGRPDNSASAIKKRIESFHRFTEPVLDYYRKKNALVEVDGQRSIEEIHQEIMDKLQK